MTGRIARTTLTVGPTALHQHRGLAWKPAPLLPEGEAHTAAPAAAAPAAAPSAAAPPAAAPVASSVAGQPPAAAAPAAAAAASGAAPVKTEISSLPDDVQKLITDLRNENGNARTTAKAEAAAEARTEFAKALAKAAGIELPGDNPDPEKLAADLVAAQNETKQTAIELAVYRGAAKHQGDPDALLDSRAFVAEVAKLDPKASDFQAQLDAALKKAVDSNPKLKAGQAPGASAVPAAGGSGEGNQQRPTSLGAAIAAHQAASTT